MQHVKDAQQVLHCRSRTNTMNSCNKNRGWQGRRTESGAPLRVRVISLNSRRRRLSVIPDETVEVGSVLVAVEPVHERRACVVVLPNGPRCSSPTD